MNRPPICGQNHPPGPCRDCKEVRDNIQKSRRNVMRRAYKNILADYLPEIVRNVAKTTVDKADSGPSVTATPSCPTAPTPAPTPLLPTITDSDFEYVITLLNLVKTEYS